MRRFSHWEYVDRRGFWGWRREYYPVYVEEQAVFNIVVRWQAPQPDSELVRIERETRHMLAMKEKLDAEAAMLDSYIEVARKQAQLQGLLQLTHQRPNSEEQKLIPYRPQIPMAKVR